MFASVRSGPNGAGKSSTIKIFSGILTPDSGQWSQLWWDVPVIDSFALPKDIYSISDVTYRQSPEELTEWLNLGELLRSPARQLSLGQNVPLRIYSGSKTQEQMLKAMGLQWVCGETRYRARG